MWQSIFMIGVMTSLFRQAGRKRPTPRWMVQAWTTTSSSSHNDPTSRSSRRYYYESTTLGYPHDNNQNNNEVQTPKVIANQVAFQRRTSLLMRNNNNNDHDRKDGNKMDQDTTSTTKESSTTTPMPLAFSSSSWEASDFALHLAISPQEAPITAWEAISKALQKYYNDPNNKATTSHRIVYTAQDLLNMGSVWYLPAEDMDNPYKKPLRLASPNSYNERPDDTHLELHEGDYLRIHHNPRRFPGVDLYDWTLPAAGTNSNIDDNGTESIRIKPENTSTAKERLVVEYNAEKGYLVLNKPSECIPVHPTVDNSAENIVACLRQANPEALDYVTTPHRLDQNTSGLITLATQKTFAAYFAQLMRHKTASEVPESGTDPSPTTSRSSSSRNDDDTENNKDTGVHKAYRCLVCLAPPPAATTTTTSDDDDAVWSVDKAIRELQAYAKEQKIMRHYLEPSVRSPKRFVATLPEHAKTIAASAKLNKKEAEAGWAECLMRIQRVGDLCTLRGNAASHTLAQGLWKSSHEGMPPTAQAVVEVDIELLTGRTHQIRGQLAAEGYPLVGDVPYGGAVPANVSNDSRFDARLALQCRRLEFLDPDLRTTNKRKRGRIFVETNMVPSNRWNAFELEDAWWTPFLTQYHETLAQAPEEERTTNMAAALDVDLLDFAPRPKETSATTVELNPEGLPPQASLSPGRHKYVIAKAMDPNTNEIYQWFVKSASIQECGGPYHRDVAEDLVEWIEACGYSAIVTGGGRILYQEEPKRALVYGFSYGYG